MPTEELGPRQRAAATKRVRTQRTILAAALRLFDEHGYHGVTLNDVAIEAGVGAATISNHFPTKRSLVIVAYASVLLPIVGKAETALLNETGADTAVTSFVRELATAVAQYPALVVALLPVACDIQSARTTLENDAIIAVDFDQLVNLLGRLLGNYWKRDASLSRFASNTAEFCLLGLLSRIAKYPEQSGGVSADIMLAHLL